MSSTSIQFDGVMDKGAGEKKMRKGTRSCTQCRRRKTRCVFRSDVATTCLECFSRGNACTIQTRAEVQRVETEQKMSLKARVAQLETMLETMMSGNAVKVCLEGKPGGQAPPTPPSIDSPSANFENAPLLSILEASSKPCEADPNPHAILKCSDVRQSLRACFPKDLDQILASTSTWWSSWRSMSPNLAKETTSRSLPEFIAWASGQEHPVLVALALVCVVISIQQVPPNTHVDADGNPLLSKQVMDSCLAKLESLIVNDDVYAASCEGIDVIVLQSKCYVNLGRPQKAWLLLHRAISTAQLIGLHREGPFRQKDVHMSNEERQHLWWTLNELERYISLVLGLPCAVMEDAYNIQIQTTGADTFEFSVNGYRRKLSVLGAHIIQRNKSFSDDMLSLTMAMNTELRVLEAKLPADYRDLEVILSLEDKTESCLRLMARFWHYQLQVLLHLPFLIQSRKSSEFAQNHSICFSASRGMLIVYQAMRGQFRSHFHMCRMIDFQGFTAAILLLLGLLGYREISPSLESNDKQSDLDLVDATIAMLETSSSEYGGIVASQSAEVLRKLRDTLARTGKELRAGKSASGWTESISVPYFGIINISTNERTNAPCSDRDAGLFRDSKGFNADYAEPPIDMLDANFLDGADYDFQLADVDWQTMVNMDLDQDWSWHPEEYGLNGVPF